MTPKEKTPHENGVNALVLLAFVSATHSVVSEP